MIVPVLVEIVHGLSKKTFVITFPDPLINVIVFTLFNYHYYFIDLLFVDVFFMKLEYKSVLEYCN